MSVLSAQLDAVDSAMPYGITGQVAAISGLTIEAIDLALPMGALCRITSLGAKTSMAEVIGFDSDRTLLMALSSIAGVSRGDKIENISAAPRIWCSDHRWPRSSAAPA
jgi:flagellar biosynthesis/type III secretory pathway ATPase